MICDVHAHCMPTEADAIFREHLGTGARIQYGTIQPPVSDTDDDLAGRVAIMDDAEVQTQVLSLSALPMIDDEATLVRLVRSANDAMASMVARYPDRFIAYIELPFPYLDASLRELERCRTDLGMHTVNILASVGTSSAVDPQFDDLYAELDRTNTVVFFHPRVSGLCSPLINDYQLGAPLGPLFEDALIVSQMVRRQFLKRFPNLEVVIPHLGGILPIWLERMDNQMGLLFPELPERPSDTVRRMWFDTLVHGSVPALQAAVASFGVDRLVTGSDFPVMEHHDGYKASIDYIRHAGLAEADVEQILHVNAPRLFGLL